MSAGGKFLKQTGKDILAGKNVLKSAKENAIVAANEILPGAGDILEKGIAAVGKFIGGKKQIADTRAVGKAQAVAAMLKMLKTSAAAAREGGITAELGAQIYDKNKGIQRRGSPAQKKEARAIFEKMKRKFPDEMRSAKPIYEQMVADQLEALQ
jgi:hypothetical protein